MHRSGRWAAVLIIFALVGAACSGGDDEPAADDPIGDASDATAPSDSSDGTATGGAGTATGGADTPPSADDAEARFSDVGDGVAITMARSADPNGWVLAEVIQQLLQQLGYAVNEPSDLELAPADFYAAVGRGEVDLWANGRFPDHDSFLDDVVRIEPFVAPDPDQADAAQESDGTSEDEVSVVEQRVENENAIEILVRDELTVVSALVPEGAVAGFVTNASIALDHPGLTLDEIVDDEELFARFDAADGFLSPTLAPEATGDDAADGSAAGDGPATDGLIHILGCPENAICADQIDEMIRFAGWRRAVEQVHGDGDVLVEEALRRIAANQPVILYLQGPSADITRLLPGENVMWLGMEPGSVLNGSITPAWDQRLLDADGEALPSPVAIDTCSADPCHLAWRAQNLAVVARTEFLDRQPAAAALLELVQIPAAALSEATARLATEDLHTVAADWIAANRDLVDEWLLTATS